MEADEGLDNQIMNHPGFSEDGCQSLISLKQNMLKISYWVTPLCDICKAVVGKWDRLLGDEKFQPRHYGSDAHLKASASGRSLCTQFMFRQKLDWVGDAGTVWSHGNGFQLTLKGVAAYYGGAREVLPRQDPVQGYIRLYIPGNGFGCAADKTHRLELCQPQSTHSTTSKHKRNVISMVRVRHVGNANSGFGDMTVDDHTWLSTQDSLRLCREWLSLCQKDHSSCQLPVPHFIPTRLISIQGVPRVVDLDDLKSVQNYATLSHCCKSITFLLLFKQIQRQED